MLVLVNVEIEMLAHTALTVFAISCILPNNKGKNALIRISTRVSQRAASSEPGECKPVAVERVEPT